MVKQSRAKTARLCIGFIAAKDNVWFVEAGLHVGNKPIPCVWEIVCLDEFARCHHPFAAPKFMRMDRAEPIVKFADVAKELRFHFAVIKASLDCGHGLGQMRVKPANPCQRWHRTEQIFAADQGVVCGEAAGQFQTGVANALYPLREVSGAMDVERDPLQGLE